MKTFVGEYFSGVPMQSEAVAAVERSLQRLPQARLLLAVSGGLDSMTLLDAAVEQRRESIAAVATFDHGSGAAATRAARLVERTALRLGVPVVSGRSPAGAGADEASWRAARWAFLRGWADELRAQVVTAHSWDDQVETVVLRILRGAGARGLAGMLVGARSGAVQVLRPFINVRRAELEAYARSRRLRFLDDPSNASLQFARNRLRREILPALERVSPGFRGWAYELSERAAELRRELADWVDLTLTPSVAAAEGNERGRRVGVRAEPLLGLADASAALVWPEVAARIGVVMDRRGLARVVEWAPTSEVGSRIQLAGGGEVLRSVSAFVLRSVY